jgi:hypothetical protein
MNIKYQEDKVIEILELLNESKKQLINSKNIVENEMTTMKNLTTKINVEDLYLLNLYSGLIEKIDGEILSINNMKKIIEENAK